MKTADQALDELMHGSLEDLRGSCTYFHDCLYHTKKTFSEYSYAELANWFVSHFYWNEKKQYWDNKL